MEIIPLHDKEIIEAHFRKNTDLNLYSIGDLDDFFWKYTKWYATVSEGKISQIALLYEGAALSTFLAITEDNIEAMHFLIEKIKDTLPETVYCHLSKGLIKSFGQKVISQENGKYFKMSLQNKNLLIKNGNEDIRRLGPKDTGTIDILYSESYPDNFFDRRMLETGKYFGYFDNGRLIGISGIHVYSENYRVATLGNITINPQHRGKSICQKLTSVLCNDLLKTVDNIGLNVSSENQSAINCYQKIGFEVIAEYEEYLLKLR